MALNRWIGKAQPRTARVAFIPTNISPGSLWRLRVGSATYEYTYPASIVDGAVTDSDKAKVVTEGLVEQYSGGSLGGGASGIAGSLQSVLVGGQWAVLASGSADGDPIDIEVTASDAESSSVKVIEFQAGVAAANEKQRIKWPKTPTGGTIVLRYKDSATAALAYNASAGTVQTALEGLSSIGAGNVLVTGTYTDGYTVEFQGSKAGVDVDLLIATSADSVGTAVVDYEITQRGGLSRTTYTLAAFGGDSELLMRFAYGDDVSHYLSQSSGEEQVTDALNSIPALSGNVDVNQESDGSFTIVMVAELVGVEPEALTVEAVGNSETPALTSVAGTLEPAYTLETVTIHGIDGQNAGNLSLKYNGLTVTVPIVSTTTVITDGLGAYVQTSGWECLSVVLEAGKPPVYNFRFNSVVADAGVLVASTNAVGCQTIETRTIQKSSKPRNSIQQIALHGDPDGGTFTLTYGANTTAALAYGASAATLQTALQGLASIGAGNAVVDGNDGGPWIVTFQGSLAAAPAALITGDPDSLTIASTSAIVVSELQVATGPNWWTNPKNWSLNHVPTSTETAVFESGGVHCRYGIEDVPAIAGLDHYRTFTGDIGLTETLDDGSPQTLPQYLSLSNSGSKIAINIGFGQDGEGSAVIRIDTQTQEADVNIQSAPQSTAERSFSIGLAGKIATLNSGNASVGIAVGTSLTATVDLLRLVPSGDQADQAVVSWGAGCTVTSAEVYRSRLQSASLPVSLTLIDSEAILQGDGELASLYAQDSVCRYHAGGNLGRQDNIEELTVDGDSQVIVKSTAHGLSTGNTVFVRDLFAFEDGYYSISVIDANHFTLLGSDTTWVVGNGVFAGVYGGGSVPGNPLWGLADAIRLGTAATIDFSEVGIARAVGAPILLQAVDARIVDPLHTVARLKWRCDPGFLTDDYGRQGVFQRDLFRPTV